MTVYALVLRALHERRDDSWPELSLSRLLDEPGGFPSDRLYGVFSTRDLAEGARKELLEIDRRHTLVDAVPQDSAETDTLTLEEQGWILSFEILAVELDQWPL